MLIILTKKFNIQLNRLSSTSRCCPCCVYRNKDPTSTEQRGDCRHGGVKYDDGCAEVNTGLPVLATWKSTQSLLTRTPR